MPEPKTLSPSQRQMAENGQPLKKWDKLVKRNANGQFERGTKALAGAGRPPGSLNKTTAQLKQAILDAAEAAGGEEGMTGYLKRLAIENSSAFSSLLGKILPMQVGSDPDSGGGAGVILFTRQIVYPGGQVVTDQTPKQIAPPACSEQSEAESQESTNEQTRRD